MCYKCVQMGTNTHTGSYPLSTPHTYTQRQKTQLNYEMPIVRAVRNGDSAFYITMKFYYKTRPKLVFIWNFS